MQTYLILLLKLLTELYELITRPAFCSIGRDINLQTERTMEASQER